jgi:hypothetical protein
MLLAAITVIPASPGVDKLQQQPGNVRNDRNNYDEAPLCKLFPWKRAHIILIQIWIRISKKVMQQQRTFSHILMHLEANTVSPQHTAFGK